jgi:hypothetical protein
MPITYLATKSANPTVEYYQAALRIVAYIVNTKSYTMIFKNSASMIPVIYADASHLLHSDARGHGGIILSLGSGPILTKSYKLKLNTKSSTESELVVLEEACTYASWWSSLLLDLEIVKNKSIIIHQDNLSAIAIVTNTRFFNMNKHLVNRAKIIGEALSTKLISIQHLSTTLMVADLLTKLCDENTIKKFLSLMNFRFNKDDIR